MALVISGNKPRVRWMFPVVLFYLTVIFFFLQCWKTICPFTLTKFSFLILKPVSHPLSFHTLPRAFL